MSRVVADQLSFLFPTGLAPSVPVPAQCDEIGSVEQADKALTPKALTASQSKVMPHSGAATAGKAFRPAARPTRGTRPAHTVRLVALGPTICGTAPSETPESLATPAAAAAPATPSADSKPQPPDQLTGATVGAAVHAAPINLAELFEQLGGMRSLELSAVRNMRSAVKAIGRVVGQPLHSITTDPAQLRDLLENAFPARAALSSDRWMRVKSLALGALRAAGINVMRGRAAGGLSPAWAELASLLPDKRSRTGLSRLLHFCTEQGVEPFNVDASTLPRFRDAMLATSLRAGPNGAFRTTSRLWNSAASTIPGWPAVIAEVAPNSRIYAFSCDTFPASFGADVERFLSHTANQDPFAEDYAPSVKPSTTALRRNQILQVASALVRSGMGIERIISLAVLVEPKNAQAALRHLLERKGNKKAPGLAQQAQLLRTIGKHWARAPENDIVALRGYAARLAPKRNGMVQKNRDRLSQFDLAANVDALLGLPARVMRQVNQSNTGSRADALRAMYAVAVEILIVAPMRCENLCGIDTDRHIIDTRRGRSTIRRISIHETKTGVHFERGLPRECYVMIDNFLNVYRGRVHPAPGSWLFPGRTGGERAVTRFSTSISDFIYREVGLVMNPHLFRHLAVKLHLDRFPDDMETARLILGHKSSKTTQAAYAQNRADGAFRRWDHTLEILRGKLDDAPGLQRSTHKAGGSK